MADALKYKDKVILTDNYEVSGIILKAGTLAEVRSHDGEYVSAEFDVLGSSRKFSIARNALVTVDEAFKAWQDSVSTSEGESHDPVQESERTWGVPSWFDDIYVAPPADKRNRSILIWAELQKEFSDEGEESKNDGEVEPPDSWGADITTKRAMDVVPGDRVVAYSGSSRGYYLVGATHVDVNGKVSLSTKENSQTFWTGDQKQEVKVYNG